MQSLIVVSSLMCIVVKVYFFVALNAVIGSFKVMQILTKKSAFIYVMTKGAFLAFTMLGLSFMTPNLLADSALISKAVAQEAKIVVQGSGLPVPRFVTLKSDEVNMRVGPGREYPKSWVYRRKGLPLKVIAEFDVWRKVIDHEQTTGWVHSQLVTLKRTALITNRLTKLYSQADDQSPVIAVAEQGVLMELQTCGVKWCRIANDDLRAFVHRDDIWGILENETLD